MRFLPLNRKNVPIISYKDHPELQHGLEEGEWINEAVAAGYGIGTFLDNSGLVVIDTDSDLKLGRKTVTVYGWQSFQSLCVTAGLPGIPHTFTVQTKTPGHYHFYFRQNPQYPLTRTSIHSQIPQADVKVTGYVVSWHTKGYEVVRGTPVQVLPSVLAQRLYREKTYGTAGVQSVSAGDRPITDDYADYLLTTIAGTVNGSRNAQLYRTAKTFQDAGLTSLQDRSRLMQAAVTAGLREAEAERTVESAFRR